MTEMTEAYAWRDRELIDSQGDKIGTIEEIYEDEQTGKPEWALVKSGLLGKNKQFVPLAGASPEGENVRVGVTKDQVKDAPGVEADNELSVDEERRLFEHYGIPYDGGSVTAQGAPSGTGTGRTDRTDRSDRTDDTAGRGTVGRDTSGPTTDDAMTRSEEELRVGTEQAETGRVRLRKHVVTENVQQTVPVRREEVRVEREPITDANRGAAESGPDISDEEHEVVLREERPVVSKETVAKERVRMDKDVETEQREVGGEVRKEQITVDDDR
jgi:uncharacterized protein (TIGR02271 family)